MQGEVGKVARTGGAFSFLSSVFPKCGVVGEGEGS